jgi:aconitase A
VLITLAPTIQAGAYDKLPYTSRILAEQLVRRCDPDALTDSLKQLIERKRDLDFPWYPARVVCHDILGQTALVDLAGLRDAIAEKGGDPAKVNPVVPTQLIVDQPDHWRPRHYLQHDAGIRCYSRDVLH